jgi:glycosyltransferase involved in cell wall biosynthesis
LVNLVDIPLVLTIHGFELFNPALNTISYFRGLRGAYQRWLRYMVLSRSIHNAHAIVSIAGTYVSQMLGNLLEKKRIFYIENPVSPDFFCIRPDYNSSSFIFLYVGTIEEIKNILSLIKSFGLIAGKWSEAELHIAGNIVEEEYYRIIYGGIKQMGLHNRVKFLGRLKQSQLLKAYNDSAIVVTASIQETSPMSLAQAMAMGKPVIATRVGGIPWMIKDGVSGFLVEPNNIYDMANKMDELLRDQSKRSLLGNAAREYACQYFTEGAVAEKTVQSYRALLESSALSLNR